MDTNLSDRKHFPEGIKEIQNIEMSMAFVEENIADHPISRAFISEMHKMIVGELMPPPQGEGDPTPGQYRQVNLEISKSTHKPPEWLKVNEYMEELLDFVNREDSPKYEFVKNSYCPSSICLDSPVSKWKWKDCSLVYLCNACQSWV